MSTLPFSLPKKVAGRRSAGLGRSTLKRHCALRANPRPSPSPIGRSEERPSLDGLWERGIRFRPNPSVGTARGLARRSCSTSPKARSRSWQRNARASLSGRRSSSELHGMKRPIEGKARNALDGGRGCSCVAGRPKADHLSLVRSIRELPEQFSNPTHRRDAEQHPQGR